MKKESVVINTVKACWFRRDISCAVGSRLAGYGPDDISTSKFDNLEANGLCLDDGIGKLLILSLDLLGMNEDVLTPIRTRIAEVLGIDAVRVLLTCTHTHGGPASRWTVKRDTMTVKRMPADDAYMKFLSDTLVAAVHDMVVCGEWRECFVGFNSVQVDENRNRRYTTADNCTAAAEYRRVLLDIGTGIADKELGTIALLDPGTMEPLYVIGNYAAHALAAHAPGNAGHRITADYPGFFRRYLADELGCGAMFVSGASGDVVPKENELGLDGARRTGVNLAKATVASVIDIQRNVERFLLPTPRLGAEMQCFETPLIGRWRELLGRDSVTLSVQCISVGDIAFVGVPGEIVCELGLEIKWHSPFRRTFIAYLATDYCGYISPMSHVASGAIP